MKFMSLILAILCVSGLYALDTEVDVAHIMTVNTGRSVPFWFTHGGMGYLDGFEDELFAVSGSVNAAISFSPYLEAAASFLYSADEGDYAAAVPVSYLRFSYLGWQAFLGKMPFTIGNQYDPLSSGSMILSGNAQPIPRIAFGTDGYWDVPYTFGYLSVNALYSHGWLDEQRSTRNAYLHEKYLIGKINLPYVSPFFGLVHEAMWGGKTASDSWPDGLDDYMRVVLIKGGDDDAPLGEQINRLGSHLGIWDMGFYFDIPDYIDGQIYYQHFFEANSSARFNNRYDGLWGVHLHSQKKLLFDHLLYEFLYTKYQGGDVSHEDGGRQMYYENGMYANGWTYLNYILGNPLITVQGSDENLRVTNSRIIAHHFGLSGENGRLSYLLRYTFTMNYGRYYTNRDVRFDTGSLMQHSALVSLEYHYDDNWTFKTGFGLDLGELYKNSAGMCLSIGYTY